MFSASVVF